MNVHRFQSALVMTACLMAIRPVFPAIAQTSPPITIAQSMTSFRSIFGIFRRRRRQSGGRGESICAIAPLQLVDRESNLSTKNSGKIWSDRPLFLWKVRPGSTAIPQRIELFVQNSNEPIWIREIFPGETFVIYDGKPLQPGQSYQWQIISDTMETLKIEFQVMSEAEPNEYLQKLRVWYSSIGVSGSSLEISNSLERELAEAIAQNTSPEAIALARAEIFAQHDLLSDALRELYTVENPSDALRGAIAEIQSYDFCCFEGCDRENP